MYLKGIGKENGGIFVLIMEMWQEMSPIWYVVYLQSEDEVCGR